MKPSLTEIIIFHFTQTPANWLIISDLINDLPSGSYKQNIYEKYKAKKITKLKKYFLEIIKLYDKHEQKDFIEEFLIIAMNNYINWEKVFLSIIAKKKN